MTRKANRSSAGARRGRAADPPPQSATPAAPAPASWSEVFGEAPAEPELVGLREYAQRRGVRQREVQDAIARGVLRASVQARGDRRLLDPIEADREWEAAVAEDSGPLGRPAITAGEAARAARPGGEGPTPLSVRAYARRRGVAEGVVRDAIARGRLARSVQQVGWRRMIDPLAADREWEANTAPASEEKAERPQRDDGRSREAGRAAILRALAEEDLEEEDAVFMRERAARERWARRKERLQVLQLRAELVERAEIDRRAFTCARIVRDALQGLSDRIAPVLAPAMPAADVARILEREIAQALEEMSAALAGRVQADAG